MHSYSPDSLLPNPPNPNPHPPTPKRFPFVAAKRAQRLCRHLLNVAGSFSAALDAHDTYSCPPLIPVAGELEDVGQQLQACLLALAGVLKCTVAVERAVDMVVNLEDLVRHLFLTVLAQGGAAEESSTDAILGVTFLAMLFNATYVVGVSWGGEGDEGVGRPWA